MLGSQGLKAKRWPYEESAAVPLIMRYPGKIKPGKVINDPINTPDIYPSLAGLANVKVTEKLDGLDFSAFITEKTSKPPRDYAFLSMPYAYVPWPGWRALRTKDYMYARTKSGPWILYNIKKDPYELKNLVKDKSSQSLVKKMDRRLASVMKEAGDSWGIKVADADLKLVSKWDPGASKQQSQNLGGDYPGKVKGSGKKKKSKGNKKKKKK